MGVISVYIYIYIIVRVRTMYARTFRLRVVGVRLMIIYYDELCGADSGGGGSGYRWKWSNAIIIVPWKTQNKNNAVDQVIIL